MHDLTPAWTLQVDPLTTAIGYVHVQIERPVTPSVSIYAGPHLRLFDGILADGNGPYLGVGGELGARWYPSHHAPTGFWLMGRGVLARLWTTDGTHQHAIGGYGSALAGYTGLVDGWFVLSGGLGVQRIQYEVGGYGVESWFPAAHTAVGVAL